MTTITFVFVSETDAKEVMDRLKSKDTLLWNNDTKQAKIKAYPEDMSVKVFMSTVALPQPIKL